MKTRTTEIFQVDGAIEIARAAQSMMANDLVRLFALAPRPHCTVIASHAPSERACSMAQDSQLIMSDIPREGDVVVARVNGSVGLFIVTASPDHCLYAPCDSTRQAVRRARKVAAMSSVDAWRHNSEEAFERIASHREGAVQPLDMRTTPHEE